MSGAPHVRTPALLFHMWIGERVNKHVKMSRWRKTQRRFETPETESKWAPLDISVHHTNKLDPYRCKNGAFDQHYYTYNKHNYLHILLCLPIFIFIFL